MIDKGLFAAIAAGVLAVSLAACDTPPSLEAGSPAAARLAGFGERAIKLKAGDKLRITVYGEDKLSSDYEINANGMVSIPLAGTVPAAGQTADSLESLLQKKLEKGGYLRDPKVSVEITNLRPFFVLGEVDKPGQYPYLSGLNVMSAIAVAGGNTFRASETRVMIQRAGEPEFVDYPLSPRIQVYPGDLIKVPPRYF